MIIELKTNEGNKSVGCEKISEKNNIAIPKTKFEQIKKYLKEKSFFKKFIKEVEYRIKTEFNHKFPLRLKIKIQKLINNDF